MNYENVYELHLQLLKVYEKNTKHSGAYESQINYYKRQLFIFAEDNVQRIFVINQLLKIYEKIEKSL